MKRVLPTRFRYPLFFTAVMLMFLAGVAERYFGLGKGIAEASVALGFVLFVISIAL
ncbi:MAG: hypothetical protein QXW10_00440 [Candidatus Micrarchaeaceae archaeon]